MPTIIRPNGKPGHSEVHWSPIMKAAVSAIFALLVAGIGSSVLLLSRVAVLESVTIEIHEDIKGHMLDSERHESADQKRARIRDEIERYHAGRNGSPP